MPQNSSPVFDSEVAGAVAKFFHGGEGPSHSTVSRCLVNSGYNDNYQYDPERSGPNKEQRVLNAFAEAQRRPVNARKLLDSLLSALRLHGSIAPDKTTPSNQEQVLRRSLARHGWYLNEDGLLRSFAGADVEVHGRQALQENLDRLRRSTADPALLIGTAKDLLESVAKFVLEEHDMLPPKASFNQLWYLARERLGALPQQVDPDLPGREALRKINGSIWTIAEQVNELRNLQGTGHGRTMPMGVSEDLALLVIREACSVAEYILNLLERSHGR